MIRLQPYRPLNSPLVAKRAMELVQDNTNWLQQHRPEVISGYTDYQHALNRVVRIAVNAELNAYLIRKDRVTVGLATTIAGQTITLPGIKRINYTGMDIDYWTIPNMLDERDHRHVIEDLGEYEHRTADSKWFSALRPGEEAIAAGIVSLFPVQLGPEALQMPMGDPYGIAKDGDPVRLFLA